MGISHEMKFSFFAFLVLFIDELLDSLQRLVGLDLWMT